MAARNVAAAGPPPLLDSLDDIDRPWLERALAAAGHEIALAGFVVEPIGAGNVSDTARITLAHDDARAPRSLVAKFRPRDPAVHAHGVGSGAYWREGGGYRLLSGVRGGCRIPGLFWLAGTDDNINLLMEDLSRSTRAGDQIAGCGIDDARAVVRQLARLHRSFWPLADADAPDWAIRMPAAGDYWVPVVERAVPLVADRFAGRLSGADIALTAAAAPLARAWHDLRHPAMSITHGDPRVDNVLFEDTPSGPVAVLIDWQVTGLRNPMHDVGYFLSGSLAIEDRRAHEHALLDLYAEEFGRDRGYADRQIVDDYRIQLVSGLMTTMAATAVLPDVEPVNRLLLALLERNCAAVADWRSLDAIRAAAQQEPGEQQR